MSTETCSCIHSFSGTFSVICAPNPANILRLFHLKINNTRLPARSTRKTMAMATGTPTETPIITPRFVVPSPPKYILKKRKQYLER